MHIASENALKRAQAVFLICTVSAMVGDFCFLTELLSAEVNHVQLMIYYGIVSSDHKRKKAPTTHEACMAKI